jgi:pyrimidine-nucleoside phosphorylase
MRIYDIIKKKRDGHSLSKEEIDFFVKGYTVGDIPDYQMSALLMAVFLRGMTHEETVALTMAMARSGETVDLSAVDGPKADKHSTGGVGDKTTLIVAPIVAACGVKVAKMSGKGLGHTGGTVDKLESIEGYKTSISRERFIEIANKVGLSVIGQSGNLAPADKKIYALRDVTATVESLPLIVSSIMSKKIAVGADCIALDVKAGSGSFCKTREEAANLAKELVAVGKGAGKSVCALITDMDIPLGYAIGNSLEVIEALEVLSGGGPRDLQEVSLALAASMLQLALKNSYEACLAVAQEAIRSGKAKERLLAMVKEHGGRTDILANIGLFPRAAYTTEIRSAQEGYITHMNTESLGVASLLLGAGRIKKEDSIDYLAGITLCKKTGDYVRQGDVLAILHASDPVKFREAQATFIHALDFGTCRPVPAPLIIDRIC